MKPGYAERISRGTLPCLIALDSGEVVDLDGNEIQGPPKSLQRRLRRVRQAGAMSYGSSGSWLILRKQQPHKPRRREARPILDSFGRRLPDW